MPVTQDADFKTANGLRYIRFLELLHQQHVFDWYMEIGCRSGKSFAPVRSRTIAVDPFFSIETNVIGAKPALHCFQQTSDDFFAGGFLSRNGIALSYSFLDGMHLYEYLLRDFMNTEANAHPDGLIALHDCVPGSLDMTLRDHTKVRRIKKGWTGDVWKLIPILKEYRPDLTVTVFDCAPTGLVVVSGLDPANRVLQSEYDSIVARYAVDLQDYGLDRFWDSFEFASARDAAAQGFALWEPAAAKAGAGQAPAWVSP
jgi:hypothetical protein